MGKNDLGLMGDRVSKRALAAGCMMTTIRADYFGRTHFASIMGFSSLVVMLGMIGGPLFAGFMADIADGYTTGFIIIAFLTATGSVFFNTRAKPH